MNRVLRSRHRATATALAVLLPVLFTIALASRTAPPSVPELPFAVQTDHRLVRHTLDDGVELEIWIDRQATPAAVWLRPVQDLRQPDLLAYWVAPPTPGEDEPARYLLGALAGTQLRRFELPADFAGEGRIELMSLGHGRWLGGVDVGPLSAEGSSR